MRTKFQREWAHLEKAMMKILVMYYDNTIYCLKKVNTCFTYRHNSQRRSSLPSLRLEGKLTWGVDRREFDRLTHMQDLLMCCCAAESDLIRRRTSVVDHWM